MWFETYLSLQGSFLRHLLFLLNVNYMSLVTNQFNFNICADATTLVNTIDYSLSLDMIINGLSINILKTKCKLFHPR